MCFENQYSCRFDLHLIVRIPSVGMVNLKMIDESYDGIYKKCTRSGSKDWD